MFTVRTNEISWSQKTACLFGHTCHERGIRIYAPLRLRAAAPYSHTPTTEALTALRSTMG
jgi:hypothetical protein